MQVLSQVEKRLDEIAGQLNSLPLIEQHLTILGHQLDGLSALATRSFGATISPEAKAAAVKEAERMAKETEEEEAAELKEREGRGIGDGGNAVTDADLKQWEEERSLE